MQKTWKNELHLRMKKNGFFEAIKDLKHRKPHFNYSSQGGD